MSKRIGFAHCENTMIQFLKGGGGGRFTKRHSYKLKWFTGLSIGSAGTMNDDCHACLILVFVLICIFAAESD